MKEQIELKPCPFCGGNAIVKEGFVYMDKCMRVRCENGCVATKPILIDHPSYTQKTFPKLDESTRYTAEQAAQIVADLWNTRAKHENVEQELFEARLTFLPSAARK